MATPSHPRSGLPNNSANHVNSYAQGYPKLAHSFSEFPLYLHLRRFSVLSIRALLDSQHELIEIENRMLELEKLFESSLKGSKEWHHLADFGSLRDNSNLQSQQSKEYSELYVTLRQKLEAYEKAIIRFDILAPKVCDPPKLHHVQGWLAKPDICASMLCGFDADVWGKLHKPSEHAKDLIQVVRERDRSSIFRLFETKLLPRASTLPKWLRFLLSLSGEQLDVYQQRSHSVRRLENRLTLIGNLASLVLLFAAVGVLYLGHGKGLSIAIFYAIVAMVSECTRRFENFQFVLMFATICAALINFLTNPGGKVDA